MNRLTSVGAVAIVATAGSAVTPAGASLPTAGMPSDSTAAATSQADAFAVERARTADTARQLNLSSGEELRLRSVLVDPSQDRVRTGTGNTMYSGQVGIGTTGSFQLRDPSRGGNNTTDLNQGTSGAPGTLFTDADDVWGNGATSSRQTAGADAHYGAQLTWDYYKNVHGRSGIFNNGVGARSRVHYGNAYVNAFWSKTVSVRFTMTEDASLQTSFFVDDTAVTTS